MVRKYELDPQKIKIQVSAGIKKCCYGRNDSKVFPDTLKSWGLRFGDVATEGDRQGQPSLNLSALIFNALQRSGVNSANIEIDSSCTCCDGQYFSNVKGDTERNLLLVKPIITVEN